MGQAGFWRNQQPTNQRVVLGGYGSFNNVWYILPQGGGGTLGNPKRNVFETFADLSPNLRSRDLILLGGVLREQAIAPLGVFDVTIMGANNQPRQATNAGVPTGGGASWLAPTSPVATTPLIELREQGWTIEGIQMAAHTDDACIKLHCEETATYPDASHFTLRGCYLSGGLIGLEDYGGASHLLIEDNFFADMAGAGGGAIVVTNQGIRIPQRWVVRNNRIAPCVNGIIGAFVDCAIINNVISKSTTATMNLASGNTGLRNFVSWNTFNIAAADFDPAGGVTGNATDTWQNYLQDTLEYGVPAN
jgi:hypothetical protein